MKWVEIAPSKDVVRSEFLSEYLNSLGHKNEFSFVESTWSELEDVVKQCQLEYDQIRIHPDFGDKVISFYDQNISETVKVGAADAIVKEKDGWWLRSFTYKAFPFVVSHKGAHLDLDSAVLIVGTGAYARVFSSGFIKMGFKTVNVSSIFDERGQEFVKENAKKFFDVKFKFIPQSQIVTLPGIHGVMVNTTPIDKDNELLEELFYFNFLQNDGLVWDCNTFPIHSPLVEEAKSVNAQIISGYELTTCADILWAENVLNTKLDLLDYRGKFFKRFEKEEAVSEAALA